MTRLSKRKTQRRLVLRAVRDAMIGASGAADHRAALLHVIQQRGLTREKAAEKLGVSIDTLNSWLKPETSKSHNRCPAWAVELLKLETE